MSVARIRHTDVCSVLFFCRLSSVSKVNYSLKVFKTLLQLKKNVVMYQDCEFKHSKLINLEIYVVFYLMSKGILFEITCSLKDSDCLDPGGLCLN